ncbi:hypothetical protein NJ56_06870 [Yersinia ruckeri]|nr:hypothetical protein NJ56_06870 [Yersinia ruckeri]
MTGVSKSSQHSCGGKDAGQYPIDFALQQGGNGANSQELSPLSDWGEQKQPTQLRRERCRVYKL